MPKRMPVDPVALADALRTIPANELEEVRHRLLAVASSGLLGPRGLAVLRVMISEVAALNELGAEHDPLPQIIALSDRLFPQNAEGTE